MLNAMRIYEHLQIYLGVTSMFSAFQVQAKVPFQYVELLDNGSIRLVRQQPSDNFTVVIIRCRQAVCCNSNWEPIGPDHVFKFEVRSSIQAFLSHHPEGKRISNDGLTTFNVEVPYLGPDLEGNLLEERKSTMSEYIDTLPDSHIGVTGWRKPMPTVEKLRHYVMLFNDGSVGLGKQVAVSKTDLELPSAKQIVFCNANWAPLLRTQEFKDNVTASIHYYLTLHPNAKDFKSFDGTVETEAFPKHRAFTAIPWVVNGLGGTLLKESIERHPDDPQPLVEDDRIVPEQPVTKARVEALIEEHRREASTPPNNADAIISAISENMENYFRSVNTLIDPTITESDRIKLEPPIPKARVEDVSMKHMRLHIATPALTDEQINAMIQVREKMTDPASVNIVYSAKALRARLKEWTKECMGEPAFITRYTQLQAKSVKAWVKDYLEYPITFDRVYVDTAEAGTISFIYMHDTKPERIFSVKYDKGSFKVIP